MATSPITKLSLGTEAASLFGLFSSASTTIDAGDLAAGGFRAAGTTALQGGQYSAEVYRNAGKAAIAAANYNVELSQIEQTRKEAALSLQLSDIGSSNRAIQGNSGFSFSSGSYLATVKDGLARMENSVTQMRTTYDQQRKQILYQGQLSNMNYENQARNATYQGQVAQTNYENQANQAEYEAEVKANATRSELFSKAGTLGSNTLTYLGL